MKRAYKNFFQTPTVGFPKFKAKDCGAASYTTNMVNGNIRLAGNQIKLPRLTPMKIKVHRSIPEAYVLKSVTVCKEPSGAYFASLLFCCENQAAKEQTESVKLLGIDYAMAGMAVFSDGSRADYPMYYKMTQEKLAREQRKLSRCVRGSRNYYRQKRKVSLIHEKIRNQRKDYQHKLSHRLAREYDAVCVEDLDMKTMSQTLHLGKGIMDNGYGDFLSMLEYKLAYNGKKLIRIDRFYPSSKRCSCCGKVKIKLPLSQRVYQCSGGNCMDRDVNAVINIREEGRRILCA